MKVFDPKELSVPEVHRLLLGGVAPRPIALVSTISKDGINNLSPFSFFNAFGANPPVIAFSPSRRGRDASLKDTYNNLIETNECVVQAVTYPMVEQVSLASTEYDKDIDEFIKSGLTPVDSEMVKPKRVKESPFQMECKLIEMKSIGDKGSSANIAICEVLLFHIAEDLFVNGVIHPEKIDLVSRMSANFYSRAKPGVFEVEKPTTKINVGYDQLPTGIKNSEIYTANNLAKFGTVEKIPTKDEVDTFVDNLIKNKSENLEVSVEAFYRYQQSGEFQNMLIVSIMLFKAKYPKSISLMELSAKTALEHNDIEFAWRAALFANNNQTE